MDAIKKFLRGDSGTAEAVSSVAMIGILSSGLPGIWNSVINNPSAIILVVFVLIFVWWIVLKA